MNILQIKMDLPQYKINGKERRELKKELSKLKSFVKNFWHYHQLDVDMASFYGGSSNFPMDDEIAQLKYDRANREIEELEKKLAVPYNT